jgi:molecular chaperone Hsp33
MAGEGWLRWAAVEIGSLLEEVRDRLDLSPTSATVLGRALAGAALLQRFSTGGADRIVLEVVGSGPIRRVVAEADQAGRLRGMVEDPRAATRVDGAGELAVGAELGTGTLRVLRLREDRSHLSQVSLAGADVGEGLAHYLLQSEQTRSAVMVGALARQQGITAAGGLMVEALPGIPEPLLTEIEGQVGSRKSFSRDLEAGGLDGVLDRLLPFDREDLEEVDLVYECCCSRDRIRRYLEQLKPDVDVPQDGPIDVDCGFCGERYRFSQDELETHG